MDGTVESASASKCLIMNLRGLAIAALTRAHYFLVLSIGHLPDILGQRVLS